MIIFEGSSIQYEVEVIDQCNHIVRVKDNKSKMIFEGIAMNIEISREYPSHGGTFMVFTKVVSDVKVEMVKVLRVKQ